jgi:hypothetical protein
MPSDLTETQEWGPAFIELLLKSKGVSKGNVRFLLDSSQRIKQAWDDDDRGAKSFPLQTAGTLYEIESAMKAPRPAKIRKRNKRTGIRVKVPTQLRDILPEQTVRQVHEYLHEEQFKDALLAMRSDDSRVSAYRRIEETLMRAFRVHDFGFESLPKPRGNWLHRKLLDVLTASTSEQFSDSEMAKLFDYFCPCGNAHSRETIKKFRWRLGRDHR